MSIRHFAQSAVWHLIKDQCRGLSYTRIVCTANSEGKRTSYSDSDGEPHGEGGKADNSASMEQEDADTRHRILEAALPFVHVHGWTRKALAAGAEAESFPAVTHGMFPRGGAELVSFFYWSSNKRLAAILAEKVQRLEKEDSSEKPSTREFIQDAVETRLRMILPYIDTWPQAMAIQTLPQNAVESWSNLTALVDDIWYYAGDRSVDFNWYTKRTALAAVYKATEIYLVQDRSEDNVDTWAFLDRRLGDMKALAEAARKASQTSSVLAESMWGLCIVGRNILGMNPRHR